MEAIPARPPRVNILGVGLSAITMPQAVAQISAWIEGRARQYVSVCTVHTVMECQRDTTMRRAVNGAGLATPDGMPLVWLSRRQHSPVSRVYGPDLMLAVAELSARTGYRHYFYGGAEGVPHQLAEALARRFPGLAVAGSYSPPFRPLTPPEEAETIARSTRPPRILSGWGWVRPNRICGWPASALPSPPRC
jgi:N-acetylglucosaminyldiphosphoundecaprenol N-acetyl-beta-D-mannosaminyltransferase